jgi:hypothetical protein
VEEVHPCSDGNQVGGDVERVRDDQQADQADHDTACLAAQPRGRKLTEAFAGGESRPVADLLHRSHQGERQKGRPKEREPEARSGLRVRGDPRRIIVRRP